MKSVSLYLFLLLLLSNAIKAQIFYISPSGDDKNNGSFEKPFATINKAKDAVKQYRQPNPDKAVTVYLRGGQYFINNTIVLNKEDGGASNLPVTYAAYQQEKPTMIGGIEISADKWKKIDKKTRKRLHPKANADKIYELDVKALNLQNVKSFAPRNQFTMDWFIIDFFANGKRQPLAQWPNRSENIRSKNDPGWTTCNGSKDNLSFYFGSNGNPDDKDSVNELDLDGSNRSERWNAALKNGTEIWLKGNWRVPWEPITMKVSEINLKDQSISFYEQPPNGMGSKYSAVVSENPLYRKGTGKETWFAINLVEEIDEPGEWALDVNEQKIYFYAPAAIEKMNIIISDTKAPLIKFQKTANIKFEGLTVSHGLGTGIEINQSENIFLAGCDVTNSGTTAIEINGGSNNTVQSCNIYEAGGAGIIVKNAGNRYALTSANITIANNYIHHIGQLVYKDGIGISNSVGITVKHNLLHDLPKAAIRTDNVNNCIFEYNEIHNIALKEGDNGVFYNYGGWSTYGNIYRYNFAHHINRSNGFYSDDGDSGDFYYKNIVHDCHSAVKFGGGHDLIAENNLIILSKDQTIDDRGKDRNYRLGTKYETNLTQFQLNQSPWKEYGERLMKEHQLTSQLWRDALDPQLFPELPNGSRMKNNVAVASGKFVAKTGKVINENNLSIKTIDEARFYDFKKMDLRTTNTTILQYFPEINEVFSQIGLIKDTYRTIIPERQATGGLVNRLSNENTDTEDKMTDKIPVKQ